jgi:hypothetical protein
MALLSGQRFVQCFTDDELRRGLRDVIARAKTALDHGQDPWLIAEVLAVFVAAARDERAAPAPDRHPDDGR